MEIFNNAHDAILLIDPDGEVVLDANHRACELYGIIVKIIVADAWIILKFFKLINEIFCSQTQALLAQ